MIRRGFGRNILDGVEPLTAEPNLTVVVDLDGTLVATAPDLCQALNAALRSHKFPMVDETMVRNRVGHGARRIIEEGMRLANRSGDADLFDALERTFLTHYEAHIADNSRPFPGAVAACRRQATIVIDPTMLPGNAQHRG